MSQFKSFMQQDLAPSMKAAYKAGQKNFLNFVQIMVFNNGLPVSQQILCYFVSYLGREGLAFSTIKGYLSAMRNLQITYSFASPFNTPMPKLNQILRGMKISRSKQGCIPNQKLPVMSIILCQVHTVWSEVGKEYNQTLIWAASMVCLFGFLHDRRRGPTHPLRLRFSVQESPTKGWV